MENNNFENEIDEMKKLIEKINHANYYYYCLDRPIMSDKEWDVLYYRLLDLEKLTGIVLENSPSTRVGGDVLDGFEKAVHTEKMYSLAKAQTMQEINEWRVRNSKICDFEEVFSVEYKFDGLSLSLEYEDGTLKRALTRGNGEVGENVTQQAKTIRTVPLSIPFKGRIHIQGECIIKLSELEKYNLTATEKLKNARNAAAGALRNLDPKVTAGRNLDFFAYNINYSPDHSFTSQQDIFEFLSEQGFMTGNFFKLAKSEAEIESIISEVEKSKHYLDFLIDGLVIKVNDMVAREKLGFTEKTPRWAVAFKFEAEETSTILSAITWQVGRTGKVTPVALLEPVELCGVTIKRATLNNYNDILRKKVKLGDRVFIRRSNDVIPEILSVAETYPTSEPIAKPTNCPCCGAALEDTQAEQYCPNHYGCRQQIISKLTQFVCRNAMNIDGLSKQTLSQLYDEVGTKTFSDIYKLTADDLSRLDGFKDKKISNTLSGIERSRHCKLSNFIFALGIDGIGAKMAKQLAKHFKTLENLQAATIDELDALNDIAEITATAIHHYFSEPFNLDEIAELQQFVKIEEENSESVSGYFTGKKVVLTGTLKNHTREQASEIIESQGGTTSSAVSSATDIVLVGENPGSKLTKATNLGIQIMYEAEFDEIIGSEEQKN